MGQWSLATGSRTVIGDRRGITRASRERDKQAWCRMTTRTSTVLQGPGPYPKPSCPHAPPTVVSHPNPEEDAPYEVSSCPVDPCSRAVRRRLQQLERIGRAERGPGHVARDEPRAQPGDEP